MPASANPRAELAPGHFLFTSESVGEGHPGMSQDPAIVIYVPRLMESTRQNL